MPESKRTVECSTHGTKSEAWVCQHLVGGEDRVGFHVGYSIDEPDQYYPDAWCDACEDVLEAEGEWNDASQAFADIKLVCSGCYQEIRKRNWVQDSNAWRSYVQQACSEMSDRQERLLADYEIGKHDRWDRDQKRGILTFSSDGQVRVEAKFHFAGSLSLRSNSWMWAWANEGLEESSRVASRLVREIGDQRGFLPLSAHLVDASEHDAEHFAAIAAFELGAIGTYRTKDNDRWIFMAIVDAKWMR